MKRKLFYYLFAVLCTATLFTSCSKDDDNGKTGGTQTTDISGNYKGNLVVTVAGSPTAPVSQIISILKSGDQTSQVTLSLKGFSFSGQVLGDIEVPCTVEEKDGTQSFSGQKDLKFETPFGQTLGTLPTSVNGTVKDGKISIKIGVEVELLKQTVDVAFDGNKMTGNGNESSEAKIKSFTFDSDIITEQPVIDDEKGTITFKVSDEATDDDLKALTPTIETVSDKATVSPASGIAQDFSGDKVVTYTVTAEDGVTIKAYKASISGRNNLMKFSFEDWKTIGDESSHYDVPLPDDVWASSVQAGALLGAFGWKGGLPVEKTSDAKDGKYAIKLITLDTHMISFPSVPALTAGSLFTGSFDTVPAMNDPLSCTKFGVKYDKMPLTLKGWYKYTPGEKYMNGTDKANITYPEGTDECAIQGVLYEAVDDKGQSVILTGHDINDSKYRVATAALSDGSAKTGYTHFELPFMFLDGKKYDANKKYKLAIICSSSKDGDRFIGAGGSTLIIDELEVVGV